MRAIKRGDRVSVPWGKDQTATGTAYPNPRTGLINVYLDAEPGEERCCTCGCSECDPPQPYVPMLREHVTLVE